MDGSLNASLKLFIIAAMDCHEVSSEEFLGPKDFVATEQASWSRCLITRSPLVLLSRLGWLASDFLPPTLANSAKEINISTASARWLKYLSNAEAGLVVLGF
ncbi:MAG: hypothetical protein QOH41_4277 [Blastocatellia bacterium]|jgi:hypothetical protein|nr:hypothetical protein [Blastocatellia bacterium]